MKRKLFSQAMLYAIKGVDGGKEKGDIVCSGGSEEGGGRLFTWKMIQNFAAATQ